MGQFYCCFVEGTGGFAKQHFSKQEAFEEAERLVRKEKRKVYILEAIGYYELEIPEPLIKLVYVLQVGDTRTA